MRSIVLENLNWFDFSIIGVVLLSLIISVYRGFLREAISLVSWVLAIILALRFATPLGNELSTHIESPTIRYLIAFAIIFVIVLILGAIVNLIVKMLVDKTGLGFTDRLLGILFGTARGLLAVSVILMFLYVSPMKDKAWLTSSQLAPQFNVVVDWLNKFLPKKVKQVSDWVFKIR